MKSKTPPTAIRNRLTKTPLIDAMAQDTDLGKLHIRQVLASLTNLMYRHIKPRAVGEFVLPGLMNIKRIKKPARRARKGVPNPFRPGETMDVAAKPASTAVNIQPLAGLKNRLEA